MIAEKHYYFLVLFLSTWTAARLTASHCLEQQGRHTSLHSYSTSHTETSTCLQVIWIRSDVVTFPRIRS